MARNVAISVVRVLTAEYMAFNAYGTDPHNGTDYIDQY
jgi:hypothetical protein